jgi:hypothetical protein
MCGSNEPHPYPTRSFTYCTEQARADEVQRVITLGINGFYLQEINTNISKVCKISRNTFKEYVQVCASGVASQSSLYLFFPLLALPIPYLSTDLPIWNISFKM